MGTGCSNWTCTMVPPVKSMPMFSPLVANKKIPTAKIRAEMVKYTFLYLRKSKCVLGKKVIIS